MRRSLLLVLLFLFAAECAWAARLVGEARDLVVRDLAAVGEGWAAVGHLRDPDWNAPPSGFVMLAGSGDSVIWARRLPGTLLTVVAELPDGGVIVGGQELLARLLPDGSVAWQAILTSPQVHVRALSCSGWNCWVGGSQSVLRIDARTGDLIAGFESAWRSHYDGPMLPERLLALDDGSVVVAGILLEEDTSTAVACRLTMAGVEWTQALSVSWSVEDRHAPGVTGVDALAQDRDGRIAVIARDIWLERSILLTDADNARPVVRSTTAATVAAAPSGGFVLASPELRIERWHADAPSAERLVLGVAVTGEARLVALGAGRLLLQSRQELISLTEDLAPADACTVTGTACCPGPTDCIRVRDLEAVFEPASVTLSPAAQTFIAARAGGCLAACETDCANGRDDDEDGSTDCADPSCAADLACDLDDTDGDGILNRDDCAPADSGSWARAEALLYVRMGCRGEGWYVPRLHWTSDGGSMDPMRWPTSWSDVLGGRLDELRASGSLASGACLDLRARGTQWDAWDEAWRRDAAWWVVRPGNSCGAGFWGDEELDGRSACP